MEFNLLKMEQIHKIRGSDWSHPRNTIFKFQNCVGERKEDNKSTNSLGSVGATVIKDRQLFEQEKLHSLGTHMLPANYGMLNTNFLFLPRKESGSSRYLTESII